MASPTESKSVMVSANPEEWQLCTIVFVKTSRVVAFGVRITVTALAAGEIWPQVRFRERDSARSDQNIQFPRYLFLKPAYFSLQVALGLAETVDAIDNQEDLVELSNMLHDGKTELFEASELSFMMATGLVGT